MSSSSFFLKIYFLPFFIFFFFFFSQRLLFLFARKMAKYVLIFSPDILRFDGMLWCDF